MAHVKITPLHPSLGASIEGIDLAEPVDEPTRQTLSRALADHLARMIRPEIVYHHVWTRGDVLVIDNRATMHRAHGDYDRRQSRVLWRLIVEGDRPR